MFKLPALPEDPSTSKDWETATETEDDETENDTSIEDLQAIDVTSKHFKKLPADVRYDILTDIKEARKQSSWGRLHELPTQSDDFSTFQMKRLLKRRQVQVTLEETEQEMGGVNILSYEQIQNIFQQSDNFDFDQLPTKPIASDENVRYLYIKNLKKTLGSEVKDEEPLKTEAQKLETVEEDEYGEEFETDLKKAIAMSLETSTQVYSKDDYTDDSVKLNKIQKRNFKNATKLARGFMIEYGGMNDNDIDELLQEDEEMEQSMMFSFAHDHNQPSTSNACLEEKVIEFPESSQEEVKSDSDDFVKVPESQDIIINTSKVFDEADDMFADVFTSDTKISKDSDTDDDFIEIPDSQELEDKEGERIEEIRSPQDSESDDDFVEIPDSQELVDKEGKRMGGKVLSVMKGKQESEREVRSPQDSESDGDFIEIPDSQELEDKVLEGKQTVVKNVENIGSQEEIPSTQDPDSHSQEAKLSQVTILSTQEEKEEIPDSQETICSQEEPPLPSLEAALREMEPKSSSSHKTPSKTTKEEISKPTKEDILKSLQNEISSIKSINVSKTTLNDYLEAMKKPKEEVIEILDEEDSKPRPSPKTPSKSNAILKTPTKSNSNSPSIRNYFEVQYKIKRTPDKPDEEENQQVTPRRKRKTPASTPSPSPRKTLFPDKTAELQSIAEELEQKRRDLEAERNRKGRMGTSISERMQKECMQLLTLFGIPYIVAPTEAEAQCAYLNIKKFTHGTITDDSDIWLFGGQTVYKNFFMQHKNVMEFKIENIQNTFNVNRGKLIQLAMLVGSDYSAGINGIGAVTALEILATFAINERNMRPSEASKSSDELILCSLERFREWWSGKGEFHNYM